MRMFGRMLAGAPCAPTGYRNFLSASKLVRD
jgi:hypothetical protein